MTDSDNEVSVLKSTLSVPICSQGITDTVTLMQHQRDRISHWKRQKFMKESEEEKNGPRKNEEKKDKDFAVEQVTASSENAEGTKQPKFFNSIDECIQHWCAVPDENIYRDNSYQGKPTPVAAGINKETQKSGLVTSPTTSKKTMHVAGSNGDPKTPDTAITLPEQPVPVSEERAPVTTEPLYASPPLEEQQTCMLCDEMVPRCHDVIYGNYCLKAVTHRRNRFPIEMSSARSIRSVFERAYNRALDFRNFQINQNLQPKGKYAVPACLKTVLDGCIVSVLREERKFLNGEKLFSVATTEEKRKHAKQEYALNNKAAAAEK